MSTQAEDITAEAARWVVEQGLDYAGAKRRAAQALGLRRPAMPSDEDVEAAVREHLDLFCADTQPAELRALRELALLWMQRLAAFRPHLQGAVWRGTATRLSPVLIDLYCDDPKAPPVALVDAGQSFETEAVPGIREDMPVLCLEVPCPALHERVALRLFVRDTQAMRGALQPDRHGQSWRGDTQALIQRMARESAP
jgi:hypothetical protein